MNNITKLYFFNFFRHLHFMSAVLVPFFLTWGGITYLQMMFLQSWFVIWITILEVPTGTIADHFGRKTSIILGVFINAFAAFIYALFPSYYLFLLAEFLWAVSFTLVSGADEALLYDSLKEMKKEKESKKILGRYGSSALLGIVIAAPIGSFIARYGLQYPTMAIVIPMFIAGLIGLTIREPKFKREQENYFDTLFKGINYFLRHKELKILAFDSISISVISFMIIWTYQPKLLELGFALTMLGFVASASTIFEIIFQNNFENLEKLFGSRKNYLFFSAISLGIAFIGLALTRQIWIAVILIVMIFAVGFTRRNLISNYMHKYIESKNRATVISSVSMLDGLGRAIVYPLVGILAGISLQLCLLVLGSIAIIFSIFSRVEEGHLID
ncbi:MAG: MFS transporter [archaeon]